jgi:hypothetical protein
MKERRIFANILSYLREKAFTYPFNKSKPLDSSIHPLTSLKLKISSVETVVVTFHFTSRELAWDSNIKQSLLCLLHV